MRSREQPVSRADAEIVLLRFLCDANAEFAARSAILRTLDSYAWSCNDHQLFFECIRELFVRDPRCVLECLPAALTRRGFPDMPCESLAQPAQLNSVSALALAQTLLHLNPC